MNKDEEYSNNWYDRENLQDDISMSESNMAVDPELARKIKSIYTGEYHNRVAGVTQYSGYGFMAGAIGGIVWAMMKGKKWIPAILVGGLIGSIVATGATMMFNRQIEKAEETKKYKI